MSACARQWNCVVYIKEIDWVVQDIETHIYVFGDCVRAVMNKGMLSLCHMWHSQLWKISLKSTLFDLEWTQSDCILL